MRNIFSNPNKKPEFMYNWDENYSPVSKTPRCPFCEDFKVMVGDRNSWSLWACVNPLCSVCFDYRSPYTPVYIGCGWPPFWDKIQKEWDRETNQGSLK